MNTENTTAPITHCDQSTRSCNLRLHQRSSKGLQSLYGFVEWPSQGLQAAGRQGWVGKHVRSPLSISAPAAVSRAHDAPHAPPASCQSGRNPSSKPPAAASSTGQPSVRQATVAARDIGGWPAAAEGRLHEGCSVRTGREVGARSKVGDEPGIGMTPRSL